MSYVTREELHQLVDELPDRALDAAEAFLAFLRERVPADPSEPEDSLSRANKENWATGERRGLTVRRQHRETTKNGQKP